MKTVNLVVFGEQAKMIAEQIGLEMVGDETDVNTKVYFKKESAKGRDKISIEFDI